MAKISRNGAVHALLQLLLLHFSGLVAAVDIVFFQSYADCYGVGVLFANVGQNVCCDVPYYEGSNVWVTSASDTVKARVFRGGKCSVEVDSTSGEQCRTGGWYTGVSWQNVVGPDDSENYEAPKTSTAQMKPTGITYSEGAKGRWILITDAATDMYSQMVNISDAQKVNWLQAQGAIFQTKS